MFEFLFDIICLPLDLFFGLLDHVFSSLVEVIIGVFLLIVMLFNAYGENIRRNMPRFF